MTRFTDDPLKQTPRVELDRDNAVMVTTSKHNQPPSQLQFADDTAGILGAWLKDHPVVLTEEEARSGKLLVDRARLCLKDLEDERASKTRPLNDQIRAISDEYHAPKVILSKILTELKERLNAWLKKEEEKRLKIADEARKRAEEAEIAARQAEETEKEALEEAKSGVEADFEGATRAADVAFEAFKKAERQLSLAERETAVKLSGGFSRALSPRFKEELVVADAIAAIGDIGVTERLLDAIKTDARQYRKEYGRLPRGIVSRGERKI